MRKSTLRTLATVVMAVAALHISHAEQARVAALATLPTMPSATPRPTHAPTVTPTPGPSPTPTPHVSAVAKMERALDEFCRLWTFSGAVLVTRDGQVILERACGLADRSQARPNTIDTRFLVGSLAAEFNAAAVLLLEQEGRLALSDPVCRYFPACPAACSECTVEGLLLAQATGADGSPANPSYSDVHAGYPGRGSHDSEVVVLAATLIESAAGVAYSDYLQSRIFDPLHMGSTGVNAAAGPVAVGYLGARSEAEPGSAHAGGAALYTTIDDLRRWDDALSTNGLLGPVQVSRLFAPHHLTDTAILTCMAQLTPPHLGTGRSPTSGDSLGQCLGGTVLLEDGHHLVRAEGTAPGFRACHLRYDKDGVTIISLSNQQDSLDIAYGLSDFALGWECPLG